MFRFPVLTRYKTMLNLNQKLLLRRRLQGRPTHQEQRKGPLGYPRVLCNEAQAAYVSHHPRLLEQCAGGRRCIVKLLRSQNALKILIPLFRLRPQVLRRGYLVQIDEGFLGWRSLRSHHHAVARQGVAGRTAEAEEHQCQELSSLKVHRKSSIKIHRRFRFLRRRQGQTETGG